MKKVLIVLGSLVFILVLSACGSKTSTPTEASSPTSTPGASAETGRGMMGMGGGMMAMHSAPIPAEYKGVTNPVTADADSLARGETQYKTLCATCHGDGGMGDGPAGTALNPAPAAIAHTSQMMGDDYLFWRISEGGAFDPFNSSMISWKPVLSEDQRWDVINYVRALGTGQMQPGMGMGGVAFDQAAELAQRQEMVAAGVAQGLFTQEEGDAFVHVHDHMDLWRTEHPDTQTTGNGVEIQAATLAAMVEAGELEQADADLFNMVHDKLNEAGLMQ